MKSLVVTQSDLNNEERWDIDFHLPPIEIKKFPSEIVIPVGECADIVRLKRDPTKNPLINFLYVDIASIDIEIGSIVRPQELIGEEAPSRARKVISAYDIIISTVRPTRGATAIVSEALHNQICSTGFSIVKPKENVNPFYLHYALRLPSTLEQLRKFSTGSSYPAILDEDVAKTLIPMPDPITQDRIALALRNANNEREIQIAQANKDWNNKLDGVRQSLTNKTPISEESDIQDGIIYSINQVKQRLFELNSVVSTNSTQVISS